MELSREYIFPAVLTIRVGSEIAVTFPDLPGCATSGIDVGDAVRCGKNALLGHLWCMEQDGDEVPLPTQYEDLNLGDNEIAVLLRVGN